MEMEKLVDLATFRERNGLKQEDLAKLLGVNRSYISQVETGSCKISAEKMKKLWELSKSEPWYMDDLVPALDRLDYLYYSVDSSLNPYEPRKPKEDRFDPAKEALQRKFENDYARVVTQTVRESILLGQQGIDSALAEKIIAILPPGYEVNKQWLMTGEGPIHPGDVVPEESGADYKVSIDAKGIQILLEKIMKKQEELEVMMGEIRTMLMHKS